MPRQILILLFSLTLVACAKDGDVKRTEYNINGVWRECFQAAQEACGITLNCDGDVYKCMNNVEVRTR